MSDSEDENYATFGAPLEPLDEDNIPRKRAITAADQCAYDTEGRRRFHGAFTGGFSAGYFNGVGSRDGWTPKRFKSSRAERTVGVVQRPEDFMDEEDTSQFGIAPTAIRTTGGYQDLDKDRSNALRRRQAHQAITFPEGPIPGAPVLGDLLRPARDTVGVILLKKMGWRPGQGVGARVTRRQKRDIRKRNHKMKVYGCARPPTEDDSANEDEDEDEDDDDEDSTMTFAPDDYEPFRREPKDNLFGIGYTGLDRHTVLSDSKDQRFLHAETFFRQEKDRKIAKHGRAFGVGAFEEEDEDIYAQDDMSRYDFTLAPEATAKKTTQTRVPTNASCVEGFLRANYSLQRPDSEASSKTRCRKSFPPPVLPANFNPVHATSRFAPQPVPVRIEKRPIRNANDRAVMLDEKNRSVTVKKEKEEEEKKTDPEGLKAATSWLEKLQGSQTFVTGGMLQKKPEEETESSKEPVQKLSAEEGIEDARRKAAKLKMFGKLTRERADWHACAIVYKRFNIHDPKSDVRVESGMPKKPVRFSLLSKSIDFLSAGKEKKSIAAEKPEEREVAKKTDMQLVEEQGTEMRTENSSVPMPFEVSYEKVFGKAISSEEVGRSRSEPSEKKDLYKAIFLDSEDEENVEGEAEGKDDEQEAMKSVLIGSVIEPKPSFSPPRGIFSNLDKLEIKQERETVKEKNTEEEKDVEVTIVAEDRGMLPDDTYGPALPATLANNGGHGQKTESSGRQGLFKSVVVPSRSEGANGERWVEVKKAKKSKKERKKKRKHKDAKKSKKESSRKRKH